MPHSTKKYFRLWRHVPYLQSNVVSGNNDILHFEVDAWNATTYLIDAALSSVYQIRSFCVLHNYLQSLIDCYL